MGTRRREKSGNGGSKERDAFRLRELEAGDEVRRQISLQKEGMITSTGWLASRSFFWEIE